MDAAVERFERKVRQAASAVREGNTDGAKPEQAFRRVVERALSAIFKGWGLAFMPSLERATVTKRRVDMLCGRVVTEYKSPGVLGTAGGFASALEQTQDYIKQLASEFDESLSEYFGIVLDGEHVGFVHHDPEEGWLSSRCMPWSSDGALAVLERFRAHSKHPLDAKKIAEALGPESQPARVLLPALVNALAAPTGKTALLLSEWQRLFGQAVGTEAHQYPGVVDWAKKLGVTVDGTDRAQLSRLFFALHTYYALVIKVFTADVVGTIRARTLALFAQQLADAGRRDRRHTLEELENNRFFESYGITNFMEGDFFSWYLDHYDANLDAGVASLAEVAASFEPTTPLLSPSKVTDLYKRLYQNLVPERIRHDLGEFYTPDWLADYVLERVGFVEQPTARLLDPSCGSGTFLVRAIKTLKARADMTPRELIEHVRAQNLAGFDLNPLAVVSARANLILALTDELAETADPVTIPVYLADSIYSPELEDGAYVYRLETERGPVEMRFPSALVSSEAFDAVLREVEEFMREDGDKPRAEGLPPDCLVVEHGLTEFYQQIWELDEQDWNKIWCRIINNRFAAVVVGQYEFVVGNPPWVTWSNLPATYRDAVKHVCDRYNIFSDDSWVGGIESDISTVLTYAAADRWLAEQGALGFVITQSVFKTKSAQGFRRFKLPGGEGLGVFHVDDMVSLRPFEDAQNRTATLFLRKGPSTVYPVPYLVWKRQSRRHTIPADAPLPTIVRRVQIWAQEAAPVAADGGAWITAPSGHATTMLRLLGGEGLHARKGTTTDFNNIYWGRIVGRHGALVEFENGQSKLGHQVDQRVVEIEADLVYPLARGQEIGRFSVKAPSWAVVLPQVGMRAFERQQMESDYPKALEYFASYEEEACQGCRVGSTCRKGLVDRSSYKNKKYGSAMGDYYGVWNVGQYTFSPYKVAWKEVSSKFEAAVLDMAELDGLGSKLHVPDHKLMFLPCADENAAHYVCGVLNSALVRSFAEAVSLSTSRGTRIFEKLNIPRFNNDDPAHVAVAKLSLAAHRGERELDECFDGELDVAVAKALGHDLDDAELPTTELAADALTASLRDAITVGESYSFPGAETALQDISFVAFDVETTGFSPDKYGDRLVEVAAVKFSLGGIGDTWSRLVWPGRPIGRPATQVHGIRLEDLEEMPTFDEVWPDLRKFIGDGVLVAHRAEFDAGFLAAHLADAGESADYLFFDTLLLLRAQFSLASNRLDAAISALGVEGDVTHAALADASATAQLMLRLCDLLKQRKTSLDTLGELASVMHAPPLALSVPVRTSRYLELARARARVAVRYARGEGEVTFKGTVEAAVQGVRSYLTLRLKSGRRLLLRKSQIRDISVC